MAFENIQIDHGNFAIDRSGSAFYTMSPTSNLLIKKQSDGTVIFNFVLDTLISEVDSLEFDGVHFWSLERTGSTGLRIRKWRTSSDSFCRLIQEFSYSSDFINKYDAHSFSVEYYKDNVSGQVLVGATSFNVSDGSVVRIGDRLTLGPSTAVGFEGLFSDVVVTGKTGNSLNVSPSVGVQFSPNDEIYFTRNFFVFSDVGPSNLSGAMYKYNAFTGALLLVSVSNMFNLVRGSTFFKNKVMFVRGGEVIWLDPDSLDVFKSQAIDNLSVNRGSHLIAHDLAGFGDVLYRLEDEHVFLSGGTYQTEDWGTQFNYNTSSTIPEVYFVGVKGEPSVFHKAVSGLTPQSIITVLVLDQFRTPIFNRQVNLTSTGGSLSPTQANTDANGIMKSTYTANSTEGEVIIEATVV